MWVKICGITRPEDAMLAAELGADALGFVFWPGSRRFISPSAAEEIVSALPPSVVAVGVFVDQPAEHVSTVARTVGLGAVQLHGSESVESWARLSIPVIKAVGAGARFSAPTLASWPPGVMVLFDADDPVRHGGTGVMANWAAAAQIAGTRRIILAGGLAPDTVAEAIRVVRPFGVDVSTGVESRPGVKDSGRLRGFLEAARAAAAEVGDDVHSC
jgi:phosphoribosylanthranilate isomerase